MKKENFSKKTVRQCYHFYRKYFSEVGYITREFNYCLNSLSKREQIIKRKKFAADIILASKYSDLLAVLEQQGGVKTSLDKFAISHELITCLQQKMSQIGEISEEEITNKRAGFSKTYWTDFFDKKDPAFSPVLDLACHPDILAVASKYIGQVPILQDINFYYSPPQSVISDKLTGSQGWHLDNDMRRRMKLFISPHTMTGDNGPTTFLPVSESNPRVYKNYPNYFDDAQAQEFGIDITKKIEMQAGIGEFFLADTSRVFHYGARRQTKPRYLIIITYAPLQSRLNPFKRNPRLDMFADENKRIDQCFENPTTFKEDYVAA